MVTNIVFNVFLIAVAVIVFLCTARLRWYFRLIAAVTAYIVLAVAVDVVLLSFVDDKAPPGFKPVTQQELIDAAKPTNAGETK